MGGHFSQRENGLRDILTIEQMIKSNHLKFKMDPRMQRSLIKQI